MAFSFCTVEDLQNISVGQGLQINARYEDLTRENGDIMPFVAKKDDVVIVKKHLTTKLLVCFYEDTIRLQTKNREIYGEFIVEPHHIQKI